jgi:ABC-type lipoprotein export system ATPase subunit
VTEQLVELRDVFRVHRTGQGDAAALQGAELDVLTGEVLCVLGPSGAGKSTILRVIAGLDTPSAGTVRVLGTDIGREGERARARFRHHHLGLLTQSFEGSLPTALAVSQAVELPLALRGSGRRERRRRATEVLEAVGLQDRGQMRLDQLSGGERQRLALGVAIAHRPALLLADEPTGELDADSARDLRHLIRGLAVETGMTVVIASHDPAISEVADRTVTIAGGRIAEECLGGRSMLVVSRGGWLRLPPAQRERSGILSRADSQTDGEGLLISPVSGEASEAHPPSDLVWRSHAVPAEVAIRSLTRSYGRGAGARMVLREMSHAFGQQSLTVVAGRSGSGKTTLLRLIAGLDRPDTGEVLIDQQPLTALDREQLAELRRRRMGYMPQEPATVDYLSARENILLAMQLRGIEPPAAAHTATALLGALGLDQRANQRVYRLSAGEVQRVALARAMAAARGLLILDEPTSRLDEASAEQVAGLIIQAARSGQTVICSTHDERLAEHADEVLELPR